MQRAYRKIRARGTSGTLAESWKRRKTGMRDPKETGKPRPKNLEKPENRDLKN